MPLSKFPRQLLTSKKQTWETPLDLFADIRGPFSIRMDPCTSFKNPLGVEHFFAYRADSLHGFSDGLAPWHPWPYNCFVNPPYDNQKPWVVKSYEQAKIFGTANVCLIPSRTGTTLWQKFIYKMAQAVLYIEGRLKFGGAKQGSTFDSALVIFDGLNPCLSESQESVLMQWGHLERL